MKFWTYLEIKEKVERDLDLESEDFVTETELQSYANEAVDEVERQIHTLYEDYFLTRSTITLVANQEEYSLPADIYANKIRQIIYRNGTQVWKLDRVRDWNKLISYEMEKAYSTTGQYYGYFILNQTAGSPKLLLTPTPTESGAYLQIWYLRNANELTSDSSVCDIPEAVNYVIAYMKMKVAEKELHPNLQKFIADVESQKMDTLKTLAGMFPDNENTIEADTRLYDDMN
jgi:hypothetical protein